MKSTKKTGIITGTLFLIAMITSLWGGGLLESNLSTPEYLKAMSYNENLITIGVILELINGIAVIGIAVLLFPIIKQFNERMALSYWGFRLIESISCIIAAIIPFILLKMNQEQPETVNELYLQNLGELLRVTRNVIATLLIPLFFSLGALLFYTFLYRTKLLPRFISIWGFIGVISIIALNLSNTESKTAMILALPIILNEIFLGVWLIVKGFNQN